ncbi:Putative monooxygenase moxC [Kluyvera cryocrescens]|uniref:Monooxygenase moxC n=1 Tax=Kluyvera cryocrescens TaxID=580 RepID=A0A485CE85_KLUCR|nr:Putative monooxygenase moxC [Kluyvera cryocrescens]
MIIGSHGVTGRTEHEVFTLSYYTALARKAEAATLDALFIADHTGIWDSGLAHYANARLEPLTLLSALAAVTDNIGLMATASTSYTEPYNLARLLRLARFPE